MDAHVTLLLATLILSAPEATPGDRTPLPTGVVADRLPQRSGFQASGERARSYVRETIALADLSPPGTAPALESGGTPWLILIGPDDATRQVASQIPEDLRTRVELARYEPNDPMLDRGFRQHYPGGTYAILLNPDRSIAWKGLCELREIVLRIRRLLGIDPEPSPFSPLLPNDGGGGGPNTMTRIAAWLFAEVGLWQTLALIYIAGALTGRQLFVRLRAWLAQGLSDGRPNP